MANQLSLTETGIRVKKTADAWPIILDYEDERINQQTIQHGLEPGHDVWILSPSNHPLYLCTPTGIHNQTHSYQ